MDRFNNPSGLILSPEEYKGIFAVDLTDLWCSDLVENNIPFEIVNTPSVKLEDGNLAVCMSYKCGCWMMDEGIESAKEKLHKFATKRFLDNIKSVKMVRVFKACACVKHAIIVYGMEKTKRKNDKLRRWVSNTGIGMTVQYHVEWK